MAAGGGRVGATGRRGTVIWRAGGAGVVRAGGCAVVTVRAGAVSTGGTLTRGGGIAVAAGCCGVAAAGGGGMSVAGGAGQAGSWKVIEGAGSAPLTGLAADEGGYAGGVEAPVATLPGDQKKAR